MSTAELETTIERPSFLDIVRQRILSSGGRFWRVADFRDLPMTAVAQSLSRLARMGIIQRLRWGVYYRPHLTILGPIQPDMARVRTLAASNKRVFPAGLAAANLLGLSTRLPTLIEIATNAPSLPRLFAYDRVIVHRRPSRWRTLTEMDAAILDVMRTGGLYSALPPEETVSKLVEYCREPGRYERLLKIAKTEPKRVRAILGAIGEQIGQPERELLRLVHTLRPNSRYDFGILATLPCALNWLAK
jgi:hypothetical protein